MASSNANRNQLVWTLVRTIPPGRVMSYGQVASVIDRKGVTARTVGWAMSACPDDVPWWRVVNTKGECSVDRGAAKPRQRNALEKEGVAFDARGRLDMKRYRWTPDAKA